MSATGEAEGPGKKSAPARVNDTGHRANGDQGSGTHCHLRRSPALRDLPSPGGDDRRSSASRIRIRDAPLPTKSAPERRDGPAPRGSLAVSLRIRVQASSSAATLRVRLGSTWTPGPIVVETVILRM